MTKKNMSGEFAIKRRWGSETGLAAAGEYCKTPVGVVVVIGLP